MKWRKPTNPACAPVWDHAGLICTGETYKIQVKGTFAKRALLHHPTGRFNGTLNDHTMRAIDLCKGDKIDEEEFRALVSAAVEFNMAKAVDG